MAAAGEIVRIAIHYSMANASDMMNVFHFRLTGATITDATLSTQINGWVTTNWGNAWKQLASGFCQLDSWEADIMNADGTTARTLGSGVVALDGVATGEVVPAGVASYMLAYTAVPKARGSKYIPGLSENQVADGKLSSGTLVYLAAALVVYLQSWSATGGATMVPGVLSRALAEFIAFTAEGIIDDRPAYQRRRKLGVGA